MAQWRDFFGAGRVYTAERSNRSALVGVWIVFALLVLTAVYLVVSGVGRVPTYVLIVIFAVMLVLVALPIRTARLRLRAELASSDDFLVVSAAGRSSR
ncbi:hypothetical protein ACPCG0_13985 [Propionibacteriaceae bacterium Y1923]